MSFRPTAIEWCAHTWNPATGCYHDCSYCYARNQAKRFSGHHYQCAAAECTFNAYWRAGDTRIIQDDDAQYLYDPERSEDGGVLMVQERPRFTLDAPLKYRTKNWKLINAPYPFGFCPTLHRYRLGDPAKHKKPAIVFVGSMCDLFGEWVPDEWIKLVFAACAAAPWHTYLFLTKNPVRYLELAQKRLLPSGNNYWFGASVPDQKELSGAFYVFRKLKTQTGASTFLSMEPLLFDALFSDASKFKHVDWVILGAMTGPKAKKNRPQPDVVRSIVWQADGADVPVFMKDSLIPIVGEVGMRRERPVGIGRVVQ